VMGTRHFVPSSVAAHHIHIDNTILVGDQKEFEADEKQSLYYQSVIYYTQMIMIVHIFITKKLKR
jgi:hypothetical protein